MARDANAIAGDETPKRKPEPESLMSVHEFGATTKVNRTLLAGFVRYCATGKVPPRLTARQWKEALITWQHAPVAV